MVLFVLSSFHNKSLQQIIVVSLQGDFQIILSNKILYVVIKTNGKLCHEIENHLKCHLLSYLESSSSNFSDGSGKIPSSSSSA